jgi:hypothetical protein
VGLERGRGRVSKGVAWNFREQRRSNGEPAAVGRRGPARV